MNNKTIKSNSYLELVNMEFYAYHGHFREEKVIGNKFVVNLSAKVDVLTPGESDLLEDAVNYQEVYNLIAEEMNIASNLLENVALRIVKRLRLEFPAIDSATLSIAKMNPPIGGKVEASKVTIGY